MRTVEVSRAHNQLNQLPGFGAISRKVDGLAEKLGACEAIKKIIKDSGTRINIYGLTPEIINITQNNPTVAIFNHRRQIEPLAIMYCLPSRENISFIAAQSLSGAGNNIAKYLLPVYYNEIGKSKEKDKRFFKIPTFLTNKFCPNLTDIQKAKMNLQSIKKAAENVKNNGIVYITPEGSLGNENKWFPGLGYLIKKIGNNVSAYLVSAYVKGTSNLDIFRSLPKSGIFLPKIEVFFARPKSLKEVLKGNPSVKQIINNEQISYRNWVTTLT